MRELVFEIENYEWNKMVKSFISGDRTLTEEWQYISTNEDGESKFVNKHGEHFSIYRESDLGLKKGEWYVIKFLNLATREEVSFVTMFDKASEIRNEAKSIIEQISKDVERAVKNKYVGEIEVEIKIKPMGYKIAEGLNEQFPDRVSKESFQTITATLIGHPGKIEIKTISLPSDINL